MHFDMDILPLNFSDLYFFLDLTLKFIYSVSVFFGRLKLGRTLKWNTETFRFKAGPPLPKPKFQTLILVSKSVFFELYISVCKLQFLHLPFSLPIKFHIYRLSLANTCISEDFKYIRSKYGWNNCSWKVIKRVLQL